jgi:ribose/xylose/arabinose/galactoside ABC-type transport system permease subunit
MQTIAEKKTTSGPASSLGSAWRKIPIIFWGLLLLLIALGIVSPNSVAPVHLLDFVRQAAPLIIIGIGQTLVLLIGGIDLSVGAVMTLSCVLAAQLMMNDPSRAGMAIAVCLAVGALIGLANGVLCSRLRMPAFVVTLGVSILLLGVTLMVTGGAPKGSVPENVRFWGTGFVGPIPSAAFVWAAVAILVYLIINFFPIGRYLYSTGANERSVHLAGIDEVKIKIIAYVACGLLSSLSGLMMAAYIGTGSLTVGDDYQLRSIAAAILGGAAFDGGKGSVLGTILASLFLVVMFSLVGVLNMDAGDRSIIQGLIILLGLLLNNFREGGKLFKRA